MVLGSAGSAFAGGCPTCTTNQDCIDQGGPAGSLCVEWFDDFGCGTQRIACCPGQGCALQNGEPSCVATNDCRRLDSVSADAGPADQGQADAGDPDSGSPDLMPAGDAGLPADTGPAADTGGQNQDSGPAADASVSADTGPAVDTGVGSTPDDDEGCGCRSTPSPTSGLFWVAGFAVFAFLRRRR